MRIFKDLDLVEQLGSGIPRILQFYEKDVFQFSENFLRIVLPAAEAITPQVTPQVEALLKIFAGIYYRSELQERLGLSDRENFRKMYLQPAVDTGLVAPAFPDQPTSSKQQYYLTEKGKDAVKIKFNGK